MMQVQAVAPVRTDPETDKVSRRAQYAFVRKSKRIAQATSNKQANRQLARAHAHAGAALHVPDPSTSPWSMDGDLIKRSILSMEMYLIQTR